MRFGARVIDYSAGIFKFSPNFLRFGTRLYCFTVEEMSVSSVYGIKWLKCVMFLLFDLVFTPIVTFVFLFRFLWTILNFLSCGSLLAKWKHFKHWFYRNKIRRNRNSIGRSISCIE